MDPRDFRLTHVNNNNGDVQMMQIEIMITSKMVRIMRLIERIQINEIDNGMKLRS